MKLTKQKLEQLITEEYVRRIGDERKPTNYPEYADKLTALAKTDPAQARELADALDEPLDIEFDKISSHVSIPRPDSEKNDFDLHFDFLMEDYVSSLAEEPDMQEAYEFAQRKGLDPQETYNSLMRNYKRIMLRLVNQKTTEHDRKKELEDLYGLDLRPDWMKRSAFD